MIRKIRSFRQPSPAQVWATESSSVQITFGHASAGPITVTVGEKQRTVNHEGGPGSIVVDQLAAGTEHQIEFTSRDETVSLTAVTRQDPPGQLLSRFATISDLHIGARRWGALRTMTESGNPTPGHPYRLAHAAITEAIAWGAQLLVIKGDAANHEAPSMFAELGHLVDDFPDLPMLLIPGNHDVDEEATTLPLTVGDRQLPYIRKVGHHDLPGIRIVAADTTVPGRGWGSLARVHSPILECSSEADRPTFIGLHQQLQPGRLPRQWPMGIPAPASNKFLDDLSSLRHSAMVSSGHTHRNRIRVHSETLVTEVASTKDWPGVWAGYAVHEGGISQTVRRVAAPDAIRWTEYSRQALLGIWEDWAAGSLEDRCISHQWSRDFETLLS